MDKDKLKLIACVKPHPKLYVPDDPNVKPTKADKAEKERLWRHIAKQCGFKITTEAKLKWRLLINYFIQHLNNVAHKKIRRYIPRTGNSKDQFVQPCDWKYYHAMKFMRPYVKLCQCSECISNKQGEVLSSGGVSRTDANSVGGGVTGTSAAASAAALNAEQVIKLNVGNMILNIKVQPPNKPPPESVSTHSPRTALITNTKNIAAPSISYNEVLSEFDENDENLKRFFDVMLHSTMKLPIYHQDRVKKRLMEIIDKENANVP